MTEPERIAQEIRQVADDPYVAAAQAAKLKNLARRVETLSPQWGAPVKADSDKRGDQ